MSVRLSVVVVTYHSRAVLPACLDSLRAGAGEMEVIVVDNHSEDGTVEWLRACRPDVRCGGPRYGSFPVTGGRYRESLCPAVPEPSTVGVDWRQPARLCHHQHAPLRQVPVVWGGFA